MAYFFILAEIIAVMKEIVLIILISHFSYNQVTAKEPEDEHDGKCH